MCNLPDRCQCLHDFICYLLSLRTPLGEPLHQSRRRTFIAGFTATAKSALDIASDLLSSPDEHFLTFRLSQDHVETLFSKVRRMFGFNNNPNVLQFRSAIKRLVCKQAVEASKAANVLDCESTSGVFKLEWRRSPIANSHSSEGDEFVFPFSDELENVNNPVQDNILYYIAGYIVRSLMGSVSCDSCSEALIEPKRPKYNDHQYSNNSLEPHEILTTVKDRGGLLRPSVSVFNTVKQCEKTFKATVIRDPANYIANKSLKSY